VTLTVAVVLIHLAVSLVHGWAHYTHPGELTQRAPEH
jgi:hypothetical protein